MTTERLHAPDDDLPSLDACVARLDVAIRIVSSAPPPGLDAVSTTGVAPARVLDELPGLPLLHFRRILDGRVGGMHATATWTLGTTDDRREAAATLKVACRPLIGELTVLELVRTDLSNAPGPGDADAIPRIVASLERLRATVAAHAAALRAALAHDPAAVDARALDDAAAAASPFLEAAAAEFTDATDEDDRDDLPQHAVLTTCAPYSAASAYAEDREGDRAELLSPEARAAMAAAMPSVVRLSTQCTPNRRVELRFARAERTVELDRRPESTVDRLRWEAAFVGVPRPAWSGRLPSSS